MKFNKVVKSLALVAGIAASFSSSAEYADFSIDESAYGGSVKTGDKFNGNYREELMFDNQGGFSTGAFGWLTTLVSNEASTPVFGTELASSYVIYAVLTASGNVNPGQTEFNASTATMQLWLDPDLNTTPDDILAGSVSGNANDILLGTANTVTNAYGQFGNGTGNFNFEFTDFALEAGGMSYFVDPEAFYSYVIVNGDFDSYVPGDTSIAGDFSANFVAPVQVPEPSTVAVLALGLMGLGMSARRKNK